MSNEPLLDDKAEPEFKLQHKVYTYKHDIFLPTYSAIVLKKADAIDPRARTIQVAFTWIIRIWTEGAPDSIKDRLLEGLKYRLNETEIPINSDTCSIKNAGKFVAYTYRATEMLPLDGDLRWSPFDLFNVRMKMELSHIDDNESGLTVRFNMHTHPDFNINVSIKEQEFEQIPDFDLANNKVRYELLKAEKKGEYNYYPIEVFHFALHRLPGAILFTGFLPLWVLGFFVMANFDTEPSLGDRIANLAALLLAYIAFLPTLRAEIPPAPYFTLTDYVVYLNMLSSLVSLAESEFLDRVIKKGYSVDDPWVNQWSWIFATIAVFMIVLSMVLVIAPGIKYIVKDKPLYDYNPHEAVKRSSAGGFKPLEWVNEEVDHSILAGRGDLKILN